MLSDACRSTATPPRRCSNRSAPTARPVSPGSREIIPRERTLHIS